MEPILKRILEGAERPQTVTDETHAAPVGSFYLTLAPVPSPIALPQPKSAELRRYRFFFSRRREKDRERCWLHLGYFSTAVEAQKWLQVLRRIYPYAVLRTVPSTPAGEKHLSDTQVLALLEKHASANQRLESGGVAHQQRNREVTLEDTLNELRSSALETDFEVEEDPLSSTGVRHLRVEVQKDKRRVRAPKPGSTQTRKA